MGESKHRSKSAANSKKASDEWLEIILLAEKYTGTRIFDGKLYVGIFETSVKSDVNYFFGKAKREYDLKIRTLKHVEKKPRQKVMYRVYMRYSDKPEKMRWGISQIKEFLDETIDKDLW